jgi:hypothetical protein
MTIPLPPQELELRVLLQSLMADLQSALELLPKYQVTDFREAFIAEERVSDCWLALRKLQHCARELNRQERPDASSMFVVQGVIAIGGSAQELITRASKLVMPS